LLTCLTMLALRRDQLLVSLFIISVAALTKEYGSLLALAWAAHAYKTRGVYAAFAAVIPALIVVLVIAFAHGQSGAYQSYTDFVGHQLRYQAFWLHPEYFSNALKFIYFQAWGALWPVFVLALLALFRKWRLRDKLNLDDIHFLAMLFSLPILLTADWDRTFILIIPFAVVTAPFISASQDMRFGIALGVGGLATALARAFYLSGVLRNTPSSAYKAAAFSMSLAATLLLIFWCGRSALKGYAAPELEPER
jgi:hypothetical protein